MCSSCCEQNEADGFGKEGKSYFLCQNIDVSVTFSTHIISNQFIAPRCKV